MKTYVLLLFVTLLSSCSGDNDDNTSDNPGKEELYFPPIESTNWDTTTPESLDWNTSKTDSLYDFLSQNGTMAFLVLKDGKIVLEKYHLKYSII